MKTIKTTPLIILLLFTVLIIASCKKPKPDETPPGFVVSTPVNGQTYYAGGSIEFTASFTDNVELGQYKIEIHDDFDGHTHKMSAEPWATTIIENLSGTVVTLTKTISIPSDAAAGPYDFIVYCLDKAGNEAPFQEMEITIVNPADTIAPTITVSSPAPGSQFTVGTSISIVGTITDDQTLKDYEIKIMKVGSSTPVYDEDNDAAGPSQQINLSVPTAGWTTGNYILEIKARDITYNLSDIDIGIVIN